MPDLAAEIRDPRERPAGDQGDHQIENDQPPRDRPPLPAIREDDERHGAGNPGSHEPEEARLLVTLKKWFCRAEAAFDCFFSALSGQIRRTRREAGKGQYAQRDLL